MMSDQLCSTRNKRVIDFYTNNPFLDFEQINLLCVDLFENILQDANQSTINKSIGSQILSECLENRSRMNDLNAGFQLFQANLAKMSSELHLKMLEMKSADLSEPHLNQITSRVVEMIKQIIPEGNQQVIKQVHNDIQRFFDEFRAGGGAGVCAADFSNQLLLSIQQPILQVISMNDERINKNINRQQETQEKMLSNLDEFLNKYKNNSSLKGKFSENLLQKVIVQMFPTAEIIDTSKLNHTGDIIVRRDNNNNDILFENKDYADNVSTDEVTKFINDCERHKIHGIILSQNTGITSKKNYHIDIKGGKILVYVHNVEYSSYKIQIAVDIIDTLASKLNAVETSVAATATEDIVISKVVLDDINADFQKFIAQKEAVINLVKDCQKKIIDEIRGFAIPSLEKYLNSGDKITFTCDVCNTFVATSKKGIGSHKRSKECKNAAQICITIKETNGFL